MLTQEKFWPDPNDLGVFKDNRRRPIHRWYPFIEGYSAELVEQALADSAGPVLDPFGGSGTTCLEAALHGREGLFAEVNPYLSWVADVKVNVSSRLGRDGGMDGLRKFESLLRADADPGSKVDSPLQAVNRERGFFPRKHAEYFSSLLRWIEEHLSGDQAQVARLACATSLVPCSNMIRRTDLRRRTKSDPVPLDPQTTVLQRLQMMMDDLSSTGHLVRGGATQVATDIREASSWPEKPGLIITSPPYLNGTNYFRNTKLELLALGFIETEGDLSDHRSRSITAGINNVSRRRPEPQEFPEVEAIATRLDEVAYDVRIPKMVRGYFSDMSQALAACREAVAAGTRFLLDIGDSRFAGVHVPTDTLLVRVAESVGWIEKGTEILRRRRSYDGSDLQQVLIHFEAV